MGLNLATVLAPEGITVNVVSTMTLAVITANDAGVTGHDWRYRDDSGPKISVGA